MKSNYKPIGDLVERVDNRNKDGAISNLLGLSIDKKFIPSVANTIGTDLSTYKIIQKNDFAVSLMQVSRDSKIPVACQKEYEAAIMSPAYSIFRVKDIEKILPDYLEMWFKRSEFDREAAFIAVGGVRGSMPWEEFARIKVYVPPIEKQAAIVRQYKTIADRIALKQRINDNLEALLSNAFKRLFVNSNVTYISRKLGDITNTIDNRGKTPPNNNEETPYPLIEIASLRTAGRITTYQNCSKYVSKETYDHWFRSGHPKQKDILMSTVGSLAELKLFWGNKGTIAQNIVAFRCYNPHMPMYLYQYLLWKRNEISAYEIGSVQASIKISQVVDYDIAIPPENMLVEFDKIATTITEQIYIHEEEIEIYHKIQELILQKLSTYD